MQRDIGKPRLWVPLFAMLVAASLALWLLWRPELISALPMPLRLPLIGLGIWSLGAAFMQPLGLEARRHWLRQATTPPLSLVALALFATAVVLRALWV